MAEQKRTPEPQRNKATTVAGGIFVSRMFGLAREAIVLYFFGVGAHTDVFQAAFKAPNLLQNLLGEGTMSAAFIPVYSRLLEEGREKEAGRFAGSIFSLLVVLVSVVVLLGVTFARPILSVLLIGWTDDAAAVASGALQIDKLELAIQAAKFVFPMAGVLVLSAWALGVLNSHRRFFLPYFAPALWNIAIISALFIGASSLDTAPQSDALPVEALNRLLFAAFTGALIGGVLQFLVQAPMVCRVLKGFRISLSTRVTGVRTALAAFGPAVAGRGVTQISGYLDLLLASLLATGALGALRPALMLYLLPASLFGLSVAAAELPELSRIGVAKLQPFLERLNQSIRQSMLLTIPTAAGYLSLGFLIVGALYRRGSFGLADNALVYAVLAAYSLGLVATTLSRLLQIGFWALGDTKTPAKIAVVRVAISVGVAIPLMLLLDQRSVNETMGVVTKDGSLFFGAVGLAIGASAAAWIELWRLLSALQRRLETFALPWGALAKMTGLAAGATAPALLLWWFLASWPPPVSVVLVVATFGAAYLASAKMLGFPEIAIWVGRLRSRN